MLSTDARPSLQASAFSLGLSFLVPFLIGIYWVVYAITKETTTQFFRPTVIATSVVLGILWFRRPITFAEARLAGIMVLMCAVLLVPSLTGTSSSIALADWLKYVILCGLCLLWTRALRDPDTARMFGYGLIVGACLLAGLILVVYFMTMGFTVPTYKSVRVFKGLTERTTPLNAIPFAAILAYLAAICLLRTTKFLYYLGLFLFLVCTVFTGSRAPVAFIGVSAFVLFLILSIRSRSLLLRSFGLLFLLASIVASLTAFRSMPVKELSKITEGRWELWTVGCEKFLERPLVGYGFDSWRDDIVSRLPGRYDLTLDIAMHTGGGFHNQYITMLAEQGLVGTIPILFFFGFVFFTCWKLAFRSSSTWKNGCWALFGCLVILTRAGVEVPGLFGYSQEPADYLSFLFVAVAVSRLSTEEDYLRSNMQAASQTAESQTMPSAGFRVTDKGIAHIS